MLDLGMQTEELRPFPFSKEGVVLYEKSNVLLEVHNFERALERLEEAVEIAKDDLDKDGVIKRFEFIVEILWKALKEILEYKGIKCYSPRNCIKKAFKSNIVSDDDIVLDMIENKNLSSRIYDEKTSD